MKINIASSHRFWLLDLAKELSKQGHDVRFYSYVPTKRVVKFGLSKENNHSIFMYTLPFLVLVRLFKTKYWPIKLLYWALDKYLSLFMRSCDVYIGLGTVYKGSFKKAKQQFGSVTIVEWGSKHIEEQQRILSTISGSKGQDNYFVNRALEAYELADFIAIPSDHVRESFVERGVPESKLLVNPFGVDLSMFAPTSISIPNPYDLIMVGGWSYRKGCDLLSDYLKSSKLSFLHVGPIVDIPFPAQANMHHVDAVDQKILMSFYAQSRVFVLPSREEGLAMVQVQAIACGLPIVCSKHTGGRDLTAFLDDDKWIIELSELSIEELACAIDKALALAYRQEGIRSYSNRLGKGISWERYGQKYNEYLASMKIIKSPKTNK